MRHNSAISYNLSTLVISEREFCRFVSFWLALCHFPQQVNFFALLQIFFDSLNVVRLILTFSFRFQSLVQCIDILAEFLSNSGTEQIDWSKVFPFDTSRLHSWVMCRPGLMCICTQTAATWDDDGKKWSLTLLGWWCCRACAPQCNFPWLLLRVKRMKYSKMPSTFHHTALVAGKHSTFALLFCVRLLIYHHSFGIPFAQAITLHEECDGASVSSIRMLNDSFILLKHSDSASLWHPLPKH